MTHPLVIARSGSDEAIPKLVAVARRGLKIVVAQFIGQLCLMNQATNDITHYSLLTKLE
jgi:hypothetical protein